MSRYHFNWGGVVVLVLSLPILGSAAHYVGDEAGFFEKAVWVAWGLQMAIFLLVKSPAGANQLMVSILLFLIPMYRVYEAGCCGIQALSWLMTPAALFGVILFVSGLSSVAWWLIDERLGREIWPNNPELWH